MHLLYYYVAAEPLSGSQLMLASLLQTGFLPFWARVCSCPDPAFIKHLVWSLQQAMLPIACNQRHDLLPTLLLGLAMGTSLVLMESCSGSDQQCRHGASLPSVHLSSTA